jgi:uncharacterized protein (DUF305 family)
MRYALLLTAALLAGPAAALAQGQPMPHTMPNAGPAAAPMPGMTHGMPGMAQATPAATAAPSTGAYQAAMEKMHRDMDIPYSGNADRDFVAGMIPHHQGAIDMARVELQHGHDPQLRKLARDVIAAQQKEIAFMRSWQARHNK